MTNLLLAISTCRGTPPLRIGLDLRRRRDGLTDLRQQVHLCCPQRLMNASTCVWQSNRQV